MRRRPHRPTRSGTCHSMELPYKAKSRARPLARTVHHHDLVPFASFVPTLFGPARVIAAIQRLAHIIPPDTTLLHRFDSTAIPITNHSFDPCDTSTQTYRCRLLCHVGLPVCRLAPSPRPLYFLIVTFPEQPPPLLHCCAAAFLLLQSAFFLHNPHLIPRELLLDII